MLLVNSLLRLPIVVVKIRWKLPGKLCNKIISRKLSQLSHDPSGSLVAIDLIGTGDLNSHTAIFQTRPTQHPPTVAKLV